MEIWDGYYRDGSLAGVELVRGESVPQGLYHLVCETLVRHTDGDYLLMRRDLRKPMYPGYYEPGAGGSALKGEDALACVRRELREETGIDADTFELIAYNIFDDNQCLFYSYLCFTDCDKSAVTLQEGETIDYKWVSEAEFIEFLNSDGMIDRVKNRYLEYFTKMGYVR